MWLTFLSLSLSFAHEKLVSYELQLNHTPRANKQSRTLSLAPFLSCLAVTSNLSKRWK